MIHSFVYDSSSDYKRVQPFEYLDKDLDEYSFEYSRDILSDLSKFNAPIFTQRERRGIVFNENVLPLYRDRVSFVILDTDKEALKTTIRKPLIDKTLINSNMFAYRMPSTADMFKILFGTKYCYTEMFQGFVGVRQNIKKSYVADMYAGYKFIYGNIMEQYTAKKPDYITNIYETILATFPTRILNVYDQILSIQPTKILNVYKTYNAQKIPSFIKANVFQNYFANKDNILNYYQQVYVKDLKQHFVHCFDEIIIEKPVPSLNEYKNILMVEAFVNKTQIYQTLLAAPTQKRGNINETLILKKIPEILNGNVFKVVAAVKTDNIKKTYRFDILNAHRKLSKKRTVMSAGLKFFKKVLHKRFVTSTSWFGQKKGKVSYLCKEQRFGGKNLKTSSYLDLIIQWGWKNHKFSDLNKTENFFFKGQKYAITEMYNSRLTKDSKEFILDTTNCHLIKDRKDITSRNDTSFLWKSRHSFVMFDQPRFSYKNRKPMRIEETEVHLYREGKSFEILTTESHLKKEGKSFEVLSTENFVHKESKSFEILTTEVDVYKESKRFRIHIHEKFLYKQPKSLIIENSNVSLEKLAYYVRTEDTLQGLITLPYDLMMANNSIGFIINKKNVQTLEKLTGMYKVLKDLYVESMNQTLTKNVASTTLDNTDLWVFKEPDNTWVDTHAVMLTVLSKDIMLQHDELFLEKIKKNSIINLATSVYRKERLIYIPDDLFIYKEQKDIYVREDLHISKVHRPVHVYDNFFVDKIGSEAFIRDGIHISKILNLAVFDTDIGIDREVLELQVNKENIWCSKPKRGDIFKQYFIERPSCDVAVYQKDLFAEKEIKIHLEDSIFVDRIAYESNVVVQELQRMQHLVKELEKPVTHTYNWAWVYEPDNPLEDTEEYKGLDELLLPEKDVDYSTFEKYIFNKDKMRPTNPIEILDDTTFIAKYPIKHPTQDYEEIGIVYVDVPSELMYRIFCKYYEIWYANIFKFGNMSMVDSLRMMLDFMYSWIILEYTGTEYLEPALRVFRQIRWFGEKSVMHNARYLISYEKANLVCDLHKGSLTEIENDITDNNFFYVNGTLGAIINNSTYFNQEAYINLYMNYTVETTLKFNLSQAGGTTQVYLDSVFVENIVNASKVVTITIPPGHHTVKIYRSAIDNFATCYIGGIVVANGSYTNLQITYDPELRLGNLPLNDVAKKMVDLASLYDNEQEAFQMYREGNLAVSELYKELQRYWELHHQGKIKGKRLTIKET